MSEFLIDEYRKQDGLQFISGVVCEGTLREGDIFYSASRGSDHSECAISFTILQITAYGHIFDEFDELSRGLTGELLIEGEGAEALVGNAILLSAD